MDTFKDKMLLEDLHARGKAPWAIWKPHEDLGSHDGYAGE